MTRASSSGWFGVQLFVFAFALASCEADKSSRSRAGAGGAAGVAGLDAALGGQQSVSAGNGGSISAAAPGSAGHSGSAEVAGSGGTTGHAGAAGDGGESCDAASVGDLELSLRNSAEWDPLGYPPYAFDGCTLVYLASGSELGALHLRDLASGDDQVLETAATKPRRPAVSGPVITWEADGALGSEVRVRYGGQVETVSGAFVRAAEPRATDDAVVFTAFLGPDPNADSDVYLFDVKSGQLSAVADGAGQQRFADVSATYVAFTDFSEDPKGHFDEAGSISDVALIERATGMRSNRTLPGKQAFPLLGADGVFAYLEWAAVHPEPKLGQFWLKSGSVDRPVSEDFNVKTTGQVSTNPAYVRPSLHGLNLDFVDQGADGVALYRATLGTRGAPGALASFKAVDSLLLFGPVAGDRFTLLANQRSAHSFALLAVPR